METCRLCLNQTETIMKIPEEMFHTLDQLLPYLNQVIKDPMLCEICLDDIKVSSMLMRNVRENESNISQNKNNSDLDKELHTCQCRICLKEIRNPRIFLCENTINILHFNMLRSMLEFCNINLNYEFYDRPVICIHCWEQLQISFSFKKTCMEVNRRITLYCNIFKMKMEELKDENLQHINEYFENDVPPEPIEISEQLIENNVVVSESSLEDQTIKQEIKQELVECVSQNSYKRQRYNFRVEDDRILIENYYKITKMEKEFKFGYWQRLKKIWCGLRPEKPLTSKIIRHRTLAILNQSGRNVLPNVDIQQIKEEVKKEMDEITLLTSPDKEIDPDSDVKSEICTRQRTARKIPFNKMLDLPKQETEDNSLIQQPTVQYLNNTTTSDIYTNSGVVSQLPWYNTTVDHETDSDDSFIDEAAPSSFTPQIKCEILSDDEIIEEAPELCLIEPKLEVESNNKAFPQLERMDIPIMDIKIAECYSVDVKREELNMFTNNPDINVEDLKTCRRVSFKNQKDDALFKCMQCSFETKYRFCADRHSRWHGRSKGNRKIYHCEQCSYRITNKLLMLEHQKSHEDCKFNDDDIPTLIPFT